MNLISTLSKIRTSSCKPLASADLECFKKAQQLAYQCALAIAAELREGWTEIQTANLMDTWLYDHGVHSFFHKSFAWFGDRTRFQNFTNYLHFLPSKRCFNINDVVILDTAPIVQGYAGDIGYTFSMISNEKLDKAKTLLAEFRKILPGMFESSRTPSEIWLEVDQKLKAHGFDNCHAMYPYAVLGHRLHKIPLSNLPGITIPFTLHSYWALLSRGLFPELLSPHHTGTKTGIWAIEPHLGSQGFGAKFEEILVVTQNKAYWLDDNVPHNL